MNKTIAKQLGIKIVTSTVYDSNFKRKTSRTFVTKNRKSFWDWDAAVLYANEPIYQPKVNEPQSQSVLVRFGSAFKIIPNNGVVDFSNLKFIRQVNNELEEWG
jgi:hypothetical protein